jgi:hypothetical protein
MAMGDGVSRWGGWCGVGASLLLLVSLPVLVLLRPEGLPPIYTPLPEVVEGLHPRHLPFWIGEHLALGAVFLLLTVTLWGATSPLVEWNRPLGWMALLTGSLALAGASLALLWHVVVDPLFVLLAGGQGGASPHPLLGVGALVERGHTFLRLLGSLSLVWAFLFTVGHLALRRGPAWWGWLGWALAAAVTVFPPAALVWSLPTGPILLGRNPSPSTPTTPRRPARSRARP